jgi:microcystin-dependent protein
LRGRVAMHAGTGPGLTPRRLGEKGGTETVTPRNLKATAAERETVAAASAEPQSNVPPYQCVNYIIALQGTYPSRS